MRARMGGPMPGQPHPGMAPGGPARPVRTIDKEWPDKHPRPGMRPTLGGPGIQPSQKQQAAGSMGVVMPIYTVAILVFFIYTIVKVTTYNAHFRPCSYRYYLRFCLKTTRTRRTRRTRSS